MFKPGQMIRLVDKGHPNYRQFRNIDAGEIVKVAPQGEYSYEDILMVWIIDRDGKERNIRADRFTTIKRKIDFEPGDKVVIRKDLKAIYDMDYEEKKEEAKELGVEWLGIDRRMVDVAGKEFEILAGKRGRYYILKGIDFQWNAYYFEPVYDIPPRYVFNVGDKVFIEKAPEDKSKAPKWIDVMDKTIGKSYKIKEVHKTYVLLSNGKAYHLESIVPYDEKKHAPKKTLTLLQTIAQVRKDAKKRAAGTCSYSIIHQKKNGEYIRKDNLSDVCHARLAGSVAGSARAVAILDFVHHHAVYKNNKKSYMHWIDWIQNRSPWAQVYMAKEAKNAIISGLDLRVDVSGDAIAGACIAMRMGSEYPALLKRWDWFRENVANENIAFIMAYAFNNLDAKFEQFAIEPMNGGHSVLSGYLDFEKLIGFFAKGYEPQHLTPDGVAKKAYLECQQYKVFKGMLGNDAQEYYFEGNTKGFKTLLSVVKENCPVTQDAKGWGAIPKVSRENVLKFGEFLKQQMEKAA